MNENVEPLQEVDASQVLDNEQPEMEVTLQEFDELVKKYEAYLRLINNPDFIYIINEGYLGEELVRNQDLLTVTDNRAIVANRDRVLEKIYAAGQFKRWIREIGQELHGINNPEQRIALLKQIEALESEQDG